LASFLKVGEAPCEAFGCVGLDDPQIGAANGAYVIVLVKAVRAAIASGRVDCVDIDIEFATKPDVTIAVEWDFNHDFGACGQCSAASAPFRHARAEVSDLRLRQHRAVDRLKP
jgi:hypothetical protein